MNTTPHADLAHIVTNWDTLRDMLTTPTTATWPPTSLSDYLNALDQADAEQYAAEQAAEHAERTATAMGERPVPLRLTVVDTIRALDAALLHLADTLASAIQRPAATVRRSAGPGDILGRQLRLIATQDEADTARWRFNLTDRSGRTAARWLAARVAGEPGPHRPLTEDELATVARVAAGARERLDKALGIGRREDPIPRRCSCGGRMVMRQGGGQDPEVQCEGCGTRWVGPELVQLLDAA